MTMTTQVFEREAPPQGGAFPCPHIDTVGVPVSTPPRPEGSLRRRGEGRLAGDNAGLLARLTAYLHRTPTRPHDPGPQRMPPLRQVARLAPPRESPRTPPPRRRGGHPKPEAEVRPLQGVPTSERTKDVRIDDFNAAREAGLTPTRAARYATHCHRYRTAGRTPLTPGQAAAAPRTKP